MQRYAFLSYYGNFSVNLIHPYSQILRLTHICINTTNLQCLTPATAQCFKRFNHTSFIVPKKLLIFTTLIIKTALKLHNIMHNLLTLPLLFGLGTTELIIIVVVILLLFGGKKIPELMRGIGKGVKSFKDGMNEIDNDIKDNNDKPKKNP